MGDKSRLQRGKVSAEALLKLSSLSSFPVLVDDISTAVKSEEIAVTFFNAAGHTTVANGLSPLGIIMLSSNRNFIESDRYIVDKINVSKHNYSFSCSCRNASRTVHIPFFQPTCELSETDKRRAKSGPECCIL